MRSRRLHRTAGLLVLALSLSFAPAVRSEERVLDRISADRLPADTRFDRPARWTAPGRPSIAVALSGGGNYGVAHVGVLEAMFEDGVEIDAVTGTSAGAMIGALVCGGYEPKAVEQILRRKNWNAIASGLDVRRRVLSKTEELYRAAQLSFRFRKGRRLQVGALAESEMLKRELYRYLLRAQLESDGDFDRLLYRYRPVATDVLTGAAFVPSGGDLVAAVRGSSAVPGLFRPVPFDDALLVDGGLVQNIPVEAARALGAEIVVAVNVSEGIDAAPDLRSAFDLLDRSVSIVMAHRDRELLALADLVVSPKVEQFSRASLESDIEALIQAGREAYHRERESLWERIERATGEPDRISFDRVAVRGTGLVTAEEIEERLDRTSGEVSRFRVGAELARILNSGPFDGGVAEQVLEDDGRRVLRFVLEERIEDGPVDNRTGAPDPLPVRHIDIEVEGEIRLKGARRLFQDLQGPDFTFDGLANRLDELVARGAVLDWSLSPRRAPGGEVDLVAHVRGDDYFEASAGGSFRDALGFAGFLRAAKSNLTGHGDFVDFVVAGSEDLATAQARYRTEYGIRFRNLGVEIGGRYFDNSFLIVDDRQELVDELEETYSGERFWLSLIRRLRWGAVVQAGVVREDHRLDETLSEPDLRLGRTSAFVDLDLDRHDRFLFPERGGALSLRAQKSISGDALWKAELLGDATFRIDRKRRHVLTARAGAGVSEDADRRPFWFDPGGFRDLYGFIPYGAAAPQYARAGLTWRYRWVDFSLARVYVEAGVDWVATSLDRSDLGSGGQVGYGASLIAYSRLLGPITVGAARNEDGADTLFVTVGFPFPQR